ncbi:hypothetical protein QQP08_010435, partial [Theobroma cacao]
QDSLYLKNIRFTVTENDKVEISSSFGDFTRKADWRISAIFDEFLAGKAAQNMGLESSMFLALVFVAHFHFCYAVQGTSGCPLAETLSTSANVLVLERGGSPYTVLLDHIPKHSSRRMESTIAEHAFLVADQSLMQGFTHMLKADFLKQAGLSEALVNHSYQWVEKKVAFKPPMLQWQSALRNGLLEAGVLPDNGFTYDHVYGTKAVFSRPRADGVIFEDAMGVRLWAFLTRDSKSEVILAAGALGSP